MVTMLKVSSRVIVHFQELRAVYLVFFFSSRRRHTRLQGDWSSDVCSSDLAQEPPRCLDDVEGAGDAVGGEQRGTCALGGRLGGGQQLRLRAHESGPEPERRDRKSVV